MTLAMVAWVMGWVVLIVVVILFGDTDEPLQRKNKSSLPQFGVATEFNVSGPQIVR